MTRIAMTDKRNIFILLLVLAGILWAILSPPIPQSLDYHQFADQRTLAGIPHFSNVVSNLPFLLIGCWGLFLGLRKKGVGWKTPATMAFLAFFASRTSHRERLEKFLIPLSNFI